MATIQQIQTFLADNPGLTDAQIVAAMDQYGVSPAQMAEATGLSTSEVQSRYDAAGGSTYVTPTNTTSTTAPSALDTLLQDQTARSFLTYLQRNPQLDDFQIASAMRAYGLTPEQVSVLTSAGVPEIQSRYDAAVNRGFSNQTILDFLSQNNRLSDAQIASYMDYYGLTPERMAEALNQPLEQIQSRYTAGRGVQQFSNQDIIDFLSANQGMSDAQIAGLMQQYGITPERMAFVTGLSVPEVTQRFNTSAPATAITPLPVVPTTPTGFTLDYNFDQRVREALARPQYRQTEFTGRTGIGTVVTPETYANLPLLAQQAPGAPGIIGLAAPEPYAGVPPAPARPVVNVSPEGYGAQDIVADLVAQGVAQAGTQGMRGGGIASLMAGNYDRDRDEYRYGIGGFFQKTIVKPFKKVAREVARPAKQLAQALGPVAQIAGYYVAGPAGAGFVRGLQSEDKFFDFKEGMKTAAKAYVLQQATQGMTAGAESAPAPIDTATAVPVDQLATAPPPGTPVDLPSDISVTPIPPGTTAPLSVDISATAPTGTSAPIQTSAPAVPTGQAPVDSPLNTASAMFDLGIEGAKAVGIDTVPKAVLAGSLGIAAIQGAKERREFAEEQARLQAEAAARRQRLLESGYANMRANPYRFIAEGGYIDDNSVVDMASGGLREGSFVVPADVVSHIGNGSSEAGLKALARKYGAKPIKGAGDGMSDSIPTTIAGRERARVADGEAVIGPEVTAKVGPKKLYDMMDKVRKARTGTKKQGKQINSMQYLPA